MLGLFHFILSLVHSYGRILALELFIFIFFLFFHLLNEYNINITLASFTKGWLCHLLKSIYSVGDQIRKKK